MRNLVCAGVAACVALLCPAAKADTTYSLNLTPTGPGSLAGTGTLDLSSTPAMGANSVSAYTQGGAAGTGTINNLSFTIGGETFDFTNDVPPATVTFTSGALSDITFLSAFLTPTDIVSLAVTGTTYSFSDLGNPDLDTTGTVAATLTSSVTPEPSSLMLLGTGVLAGWGVVRRRLA